jgi:hypothetical protein
MIRRYSVEIGWVGLGVGIVAWMAALLVSDDVTVPVVRACAQKTLPPTLKDVLSRLPENDAAAARAGDGCPITWGHEATHFLNSRSSSTRERGFYLLDGAAWKVPIPSRTKLAHVADAIPKEHRGKTYETYLIEAQRWWQDVAIYPLDELVAYQTGSIVRNELEWDRRQETDRFGIELLLYSQYAVEEVCRREGDDYPKQELRDLYELLAARARMVIKDFDDQPFANAIGDHGKALLAEVEADNE